ncbi:MAG: hypothetical protein IJS41_11675 [Clostridia bacterium]|nr:hypothetical protein [Clostridia bacterium]
MVKTTGSTFEARAGAFSDKTRMSSRIKNPAGRTILRAKLIALSLLPTARQSAWKNQMSILDIVVQETVYVKQA